MAPLIFYLHFTSNILWHYIRMSTWNHENYPHFLLFRSIARPIWLLYSGKHDTTRIMIWRRSGPVGKGGRNGQRWHSDASITDDDSESGSALGYDSQLYISPTPARSPIRRRDGDDSSQSRGSFADGINDSEIANEKGLVAHQENSTTQGLIRHLTYPQCMDVEVLKSFR